jgi:hypothetical protein
MNEGVLVEFTHFVKDKTQKTWRLAQVEHEEEALAGPPLAAAKEVHNIEEVPA